MRDVHPDHIDPDTGRPYANYSSPSLEDSGGTFPRDDDEDGENEDWDEDEDDEFQDEDDEFQDEEE